MEYHISPTKTREKTKALTLLKALFLPFISYSQGKTNSNQELSNWLVLRIKCDNIIITLLDHRELVQ
jgi:hypothetical protein